MFGNKLTKSLIRYLGLTIKSDSISKQYISCEDDNGITNKIVKYDNLIMKVKACDKCGAVYLKDKMVAEKEIITTSSEDWIFNVHIPETNKIVTKYYCSKCKKPKKVNKKGK